MAADSSQPRHKAGIYKQQNKSHKTGRHKSKGQLQKDAKGRVDVKTVTKKLRASLKKQERRNQAHQIRKTKRDEALAKKRSKGGTGTPPFVVAIVPLSEGLDVGAALQLFETCDEEATVIVNDLGICHISVPRFKQRFSFLCPEYGNLYSLLDATKVADSVVFLLSPETGVDKYGDYCLSCLFAQSLPASVLALQGLKNISTKKQGEIKKMVMKTLEKRFPDGKLQALDTNQDAMLALRTVGHQRLHHLSYRENRPHLLAENVSFELDNEDCLTGTLKVSGYLRGSSLSANGLVHLPGWDSYQMLQIDTADDPYPLLPQNSNKTRRKDSMDTGSTETVETEIRVLDRPDPLKQESLQSEVVLDPMEGEQTWPTEEELAEAAAEYKKKKTVKRVPKGTSDYQAAWIMDSEGEGDGEDEVSDDSDDDEEVAMEMAASNEGSDEDDGDLQEEEEEYETISMTDGEEAKYDATINIAEEEEMLEKMKAERLDQMFPDEIDTPMNVPSRTRFQRYRGLKSFRTSPWDPKENLPSDYARIYQFENFKRTKKRVLSDVNDTGALPGWYITIHIANVPKSYMDTYRPGAPVTVFGLLPHEQKTSVIHFLLKRHPGSRLPIKSKDRMVFHVGFRRFSVCPIYSQHTNGDKHKYERFLQNLTVATIFAPVTFPPAPVLMFKDKGFGHHELVASGSVLSVNPDRIITKRVVLSGHPFKINKKMAVVRYMFFNREDILWFKPVELRTKWGRRGHIKEPLGTHGHMKCTFDGQLKSQDTVLMNLYKRMYPKWTYQSQVHSPGVSTYTPIINTMTEEDNKDMMDEFFD